MSVALILGLGYWSLQRSHYSLNSKNKLAAEKVISDFSVDLGAVEGLITSLTFMQQSVDGDSTDQFVSLSEIGIAKSPIVTSIGRFEFALNRQQLDELSDTMMESGLYNFTVTEFDDQGVKTAVAERNAYNPLVWMAPFSPRFSKYLGVDLSSGRAMSSAIGHARREDAMTLVPVPPGWTVDASVFAVTPTYLGRYAPDTPSERDNQSSGGFLIGLDFSAVKNEFEKTLPGSKIEITLDLHGIGASRNVFKSIGTSESPETGLYLKNLFKGLTTAVSPEFAQGSLRLTVFQPNGIPEVALYRALLWMCSLGILLLLLLKLVNRERSVSAQLQSERQTALTTLTAIGDVVITTDGSGVITYINPSAEELLQRASKDVVGQSIDAAMMLAPDTGNQAESVERFSVLEVMKEAKRTDLPALQYQSSKSTSVALDAAISPLGKDSDGGVKGFVLVMRDVSSERLLTRQLEYQATHDALTNLANRFVFENKLEALIESSNNGTTSHAVCYIDLDQFKTVNDTCGHAAGDELLLMVSKRLKGFIREHDVLARLGGDEFGLLIVDCDVKESERLAKVIHDQFQTFHFQYHENVFPVRASIGFVHVDGSFMGIKEVMAAADLACYSAKDRGRNELHIFSQSNKEIADRQTEMLLLPKVQQALQHDDFVLHCQPIVSLTRQPGQSIGHYEVLLRLKDENGKLITPMQMISAAERYNLMRDVDRWVIANTLLFMDRLRQEKSEDLPVFSINLSGQSMADPELADFITNLVNKYKINPEKLIFEITETSAITNMDSALEFTTRIHELGCTLALDDFGSGVSSFGYLKILPVDYLKIDGQFVKSIDSNEVDREMVKCMKAVADLLQIKTIAEFVENEAIVGVLTSLEIDYGQGYHYSKPIPLQDLLIDGDQALAA